MRASFNAPAVSSDHHNMLTYARTVGGTAGGKLLGEYLAILLLLSFSTLVWHCRLEKS